MEYRSVVALVIAIFLVFGLLMKVEIGGGTDLTWHYILGWPLPNYAEREAE